MRTALTMLAAALLLTACGGSDEPDEDATPTASPTAEEATTAAPAPEPEADEGVAIDIDITGGAVTPQGDRVEVGVGEPVVLTVTTDAADELHVHSDPDQTFALVAGDAKSFTFTVDTPGQVAVELHDLGVTVVQLVVRP